MFLPDSICAVYSSAIDALDEKLVAVLQSDGRISVTDLAERIPLSLSATSERLKRLIESGVVSGFTAVVDPVLLGRTIHAVVDVRLTPGSYSPTLDLERAEMSGVVDAVHLTGRFDLQLRVVARDVAELDRLLEVLKEDMGAEETNTRLILRSLEGFPRPLPVGQDT